MVRTCDGLAGDFAHVRWSAYETKDPYSDVVVHEAAHLLHSDSRVVLHRPRQSRVGFADKMSENAFSFPRGSIEEVGALVLAGVYKLRERPMLPALSRAIYCAPRPLGK